MSLREILGLNVDGKAQRANLFTKYGILHNPFPSSAQTSDHPRMTGEADARIQQRLKSFLDNSQSQVIVITGNQGVGKTNLLEYYKKELPLAFAEESGYYVIQYLADPEPRFAGVILKIFDELGSHTLQLIVERCALYETNADPIDQYVGSPELREAFKRVVRAKRNNEEIGSLLSQLSEYLHGVRMLKSHTEALGVRFSLTTQEQKTTALRDVVAVGRELGLIKGILLFMDELEKIGDLTLRNTLGYLSAIRALIDALPHALFLVLAMTDPARAQYQKLFPSLAGRFGTPIPLRPLDEQDEAISLGRFYLDNARKQAEAHKPSSNLKQGNAEIVTTEEMRITYDELLKRQISSGRGNVVQREYLDRLHERAQEKMAVS